MNIEGGRTLTYQPQSNSNLVTRQMEEDQRRLREYLLGVTDPSMLLERAQNNEANVIFLDIDQCSAFGEDTFDILRIANYTEHLVHSEPKYITTKKIFDIATLLLNPRMIEAITQIRRAVPNTLIYFYTAKAGILTRFLAPFYHHISSLYLDPANIRFHAMGPIENTTLTYLYDQVRELTEGLGDEGLKPTLKAQLDRVGVITWAASVVLGLPYAAPVIITADAAKDLRKISGYLGIPFERTWLYDDKAARHATALGLTENEAHMTPVTPFNFESMPIPQAATLDAVLSETVPLQPIRNHPGSAQFFRQVSMPPRPELRKEYAVDPRGEWAVADNAVEFNARPPWLPPWHTQKFMLEGRASRPRSDYALRAFSGPAGSHRSDPYP